jgi:hypothetical protein
MPPERDTTRRLRGAVADGRLDKTFRAADVNLALNIGFAGTFLPKHCVGNPGNNTELFVKISEGFTGLSKTRKTSIAPHFSALAGDAKIQAEDRKATLVPTLLNSKDSLVIKLLIANFNGYLLLGSRYRIFLFTSHYVHISSQSLGENSSLPPPKTSSWHRLCTSRFHAPRSFNSPQLLFVWKEPQLLCLRLPTLST